MTQIYWMTQLSAIFFIEITVSRLRNFFYSQNTIQRHHRWIMSIMITFPMTHWVLNEVKMKQNWWFNVFIFATLFKDWRKDKWTLMPGYWVISLNTGPGHLVVLVDYGRCRPQQTWGAVGDAWLNKAPMDFNLKLLFVHYATQMLSKFWPGAKWHKCWWSSHGPMKIITLSLMYFL